MQSLHGLSWHNNIVRCSESELEPRRKLRTSLKLTIHSSLLSNFTSKAILTFQSPEQRVNALCHYDSFALSSIAWSM